MQKISIVSVTKEMNIIFFSFIQKYLINHYMNNVFIGTICFKKLSKVFQNIR